MNNTITINIENLTQEEREQLISLAEKGNKVNPKKRWRAERYETYYWIDTDVRIFKSNECGRESDNFCYQTHNYFKTKEDAEFARKRILVYQELKDYALKYNESEFDWNNREQYKYYIFCNNKEILIGNDNTVMDLGQIYFTSREIARNAINFIGEDRIKKYLFGIK